MNQAVNGQVMPQGYHETVLGVLPIDWQVRKLLSVSNKITDGTHDTPKTVKEGVPFLTAIHVKEHGISFSSCYYLPQNVHDEIYRRCNPEYGDVLMVNIGAGTATTAVVSVEYPFSLKNVALIKPNPHFLIGSYLNYSLTFRREQILESLSSGGAQPFLSLKQIGDLEIPIPSLNEQKAISRVLQDIDGLASELKKLIAKKRAIKTASMQQLLTGKKRLPEFALHTEGQKKGQPKGMKRSELGEIPEDWLVYTINDVVDSLSSGGTPYRGTKEFYKGNNLWITSGELKYGLINDTIEKISNDAIKKAHLKVHPPGTFLMAITGLEAAGTRGACGIVGKPATTNQSCMAIYPNKKLISNFLFHWYVYNGDELALKYCQGTKQLSYTAGLLKTLPILLPRDTKEQEAIASILSDMDEEIQKLKQRLEKMRQIKQGMMQELLTGRTRLPFDKTKEQGCQ
ncbi:restriction endonuclease subunit S [Vibrio vulnificus]|uniref:restriction endonuclease subunit S n=1 Tax=Vibrio vulnificus TaxID=672 RepID=UPI001A91E613|nr:restriction endonuclease subunit S [Vibrio vulnificus]